MPHPLDNDSLIVELKQMAILGAGIAVEAITGEQKWLQWTVILLHVTSFPDHPSLDCRQPERLVVTFNDKNPGNETGRGLGMRLGVE